METTTDRMLRRSFRHLNRGMVMMWRLGLGRWINIWPSGSGRLMVVTHVGRKSGRRFRTPLNYADIDGEIYCTSGFGPGSDWYRNVLANPQVEVWLPGRSWTGTVEDISDSPQRLPLLREVLVASGFAAPVAGVPVRRLSDEKLAEKTTDYQLLRIHRTGPATGRPRPGDLRWVWAALAAGAAALALLVGRSGRR
jgi:deazaflavin-dependent oxidoreductase (nitroreductase family)